MTSPDLRRARWHAIVETNRIAGRPVEQAPVFLAWIEEWIDGAIDMAVVRRRYVDWLTATRTPRRAGADHGPDSGLEPEPESGEDASADLFVAQLVEEIPDIAGLRIRDPQTRRQSTQAIAEAWAPD